MRALYIPQLPDESSAVVVSGEQHHHLVRVVRAEVNDSILVLDGRGGSHLSTVREIGKRDLILEIGPKKVHERSYLCDLAIGNLKKEAMEDVMVRSTELGIARIRPLMTEHAQKKSFLNQARLDKLAISACEQSNNPFLPEFHEAMDLGAFEFKAYDQILLFSLYEGPKQSQPQPRKMALPQRTLLLIGPEGGFSAKDHESFLSWPQVVPVEFPTPLLRAEHAVSVAFGYFLASCL